MLARRTIFFDRVHISIYVHKYFKIEIYPLKDKARYSIKDEYTTVP